MENIILPKSELDTLPFLHDESEGAHAEVVRYKDGLIKRYREDISDSMRLSLEENIKRSSEIFIYPKCLVFEKELFQKEKLRGTFMDEAKGIDLIRLQSKILSGDVDLDIDEFLTIYYDKLLPILKKEEVLIFDMKPYQIFIGTNFSYVDTDPFCDANTKTAKDFIKAQELSAAYEWNLYETNKCITSAFNIIFKNKVKSILEFSDQNYINDYIGIAIKLVNGKAKTFKEVEKYLNKH